MSPDRWTDGVLGVQRTKLVITSCRVLNKSTGLGGEHSTLQSGTTTAGAAGHQLLTLHVLRLIAGIISSSNPRRSLASLWRPLFRKRPFGAF